MFNCQICMEYLDSKKINGIISCGHVFHLQCLRDWFTRDPSKSCPSCRCKSNGNINNIFLSIDHEYDFKVELLQVELANIRMQLQEAKAKEASQKNELEFQIDILETHNQKLVDEQEMATAEMASLKSALEHLSKIKVADSFILKSQTEKLEELENQIELIQALNLMFEKRFIKNEEQLQKIKKDHSDLLLAYEKEICKQSDRNSVGFLKVASQDHDTTENREQHQSIKEEDMCAQKDADFTKKESPNSHNEHQVKKIDVTDWCNSTDSEFNGWGAADSENQEMPIQESSTSRNKLKPHKSLKRKRRQQIRRSSSSSDSNYTKHNKRPKNAKNKEVVKEKEHITTTVSTPQANQPKVTAVPEVQELEKTVMNLESLGHKDELPQTKSDLNFNDSGVGNYSDYFYFEEEETIDYGMEETEPKYEYLPV